MITVNFKGDAPLYLQLYDYIKDDIIQSRLKERSKLPSKRDLANHLGISVNTVTSAYNILLDEGYLYAEERVGYFVSAIDNLHKVEPAGERVDEPEERRYRYDFDLNKNSYFGFPDKAFKRAITESLTEGERLNERDKEGIYLLRRSIASYLRSSRGIDVSPEHVIVSSGMEFLLQILFVIIGKDYTYRLENPGYIDNKKIFLQHRRPLGFMDIDEEGIDPDALPEDRGVYLISPTHQFPTGSILRVDRRVKLLNHAKETDSYIIEDDYDSEYKYYGRLIPALKSLDKLDRVIYMSNFSKSLSPTLRVSFMVLPERLMAIYRKKDPLTVCPIPTLIQLALSKYMDKGYFERRLNRQRKRYDERRKLARTFFENDALFEIDDKRAGLHFILTFRCPIGERDLLEHLRGLDMNIFGLSDFYDGNYPERYPKLIIGFGNMTLEELEEGLEKLAEELRSVARRSGLR